MHKNIIYCPVCLNTNTKFIYRFEKAPVLNHAFFDSRKAAKKAKTGLIELFGCKECGLVFNAAFLSGFVHYTEQYDNSQHHSRYFASFLNKLARDLVKKYKLQEKNVVEVGCGKGYFVKTLFDLGVRNMRGFDPSYVDYNPKIDHLVIKKHFNKKNISNKADFIICRHTLEHISKPKEFIESILSCLADNGKMYFEVPDLGWIVKNKTFFDFTYEHCNYFTPYSLYNLFSRFGFNHIVFKKGLNGQYIQAEISRGTSNAGMLKPINFVKTGAFINSSINNGTNLLKRLGKFAICGAGGKGVFFLNRLKINVQRCEYVIDINKNKQSKYIPVTAQKVVSPEILKKEEIDTLIIMNPVYEKAIRKNAKELGFKGKFVVV